MKNKYKASKIRILLIIVSLFSTELMAQTFQDQTNTRFPTPPNNFTNQISIGDIDNDNDLDIIFANGGNFITAGSDEPVRLYLNDGNGNFSDVSAAQIDFSGLVRGVELGDIDDDGDLDMILAQDFNRQPQLLINNGSGFYSNVTATQLPQLSLSSSRAQFADIDNDGDLDLYIASGQTNRFGCGQNKILINNSNGFFSDETLTHHPIEDLCENMDVSFADIDNDLDLDVRVCNRNGSSRMYVNNGSGVFSTSNAMPNDSTCYSFDFGDIDGDGDLDMIGANSRAGSSGEALFINNGNGAFTDASNQISPNPSGDDDNDSKFLDLDNDGDLDLIIATLSSSAEKIYINDGDGNFTQNTTLITPIADSSLDIMVADLTGDGRLDVVTGQGESGSFTNRIYVNVLGPVDTLSPRIIKTETITSQAGMNPLVVRVAILDDVSSDRGFFANEIMLHYSVNMGPEQTSEMKYSGGQIYRGEIPNNIKGSIIHYYVTAKDYANNSATGPTQMINNNEDLIFNNGFETIHILISQSNYLRFWATTKQPKPKTSPTELLRTSKYIPAKDPTINTTPIKYRVNGEKIPLPLLA